MNRMHFRKRFFSITMTTALVVGMFPAFTLSAASAATVNSIYSAAHMGATTVQILLCHPALISEARAQQ